ncbi:dehydrodolichyl diphosphate synthase complex subunit Dhdds-like [Rhipicephalus sanguineus]|uniref:dehydrodolichyl diphosphate synthase complex subunit Dhdds-like n=1 Tax=Rhipicephalus sanguineus TaxID=34632 RepID=UPI0018950F01|nr:dehydrodolichyl diphosphate synthase complex subunit Dhdds-like [Rhipicephalus sanguineus]
MCRLLETIGVTNFTVLLCSNLNLKRSATELQALFSAADYGCRMGLQEIKSLRQLATQVRFVGQLETIPTELQAKLAQIEFATAGGMGKCDVTVCAAYSSRHEITRMVKDFACAVREGRMHLQDITVGLIEDYLTMFDGPDAELWYRSAGEVRFSDILLLQNGYSYRHVEKKQWPSVNHWDLLLSVIQFQNNWLMISAVKKRHRRLHTSIATGQIPLGYIVSKPS